MDKATESFNKSAEGKQFDVGLNSKLLNVAKDPLAATIEQRVRITSGIMTNAFDAFKQNQADQGALNMFHQATGHMVSLAGEYLQSGTQKEIDTGKMLIDSVSMLWSEEQGITSKNQPVELASKADISPMQSGIPKGYDMSMLPKM